MFNEVAFQFRPCIRHIPSFLWGSWVHLSNNGCIMRAVILNRREDCYPWAVRWLAGVQSSVHLAVTGVIAPTGAAGDPPALARPRDLAWPSWRVSWQARRHFCGVKWMPRGQTLPDGGRVHPARWPQPHRRCLSPLSPLRQPGRRSARPACKQFNILRKEVHLVD